MSARNRLTLPIHRRLYSLAMRLFVPLLLLRLIWRGRLQPGYRAQLLRRVGWYRPRPLGQFKPRVWIHAVSVGETLAVAPLVEKLLKVRPDLEVLVTSTTPTGADQVRRQFGQRVEADWAPFDTPGAVRRFLTHWRPSVGVLIETEIWPNMVTLSIARGIPMLLLNARLSRRSARGYARLPRLISPTLAGLSVIAAQGRDDARRFAALGAPKEHLSITGSLKFALDVDELMRAGAAERQKYAAGLVGRPVWLAASTHPGEEAMVLEAFAALKAERPEALLLLAPRHPDRVATLRQMPSLHPYRIALHSGDSLTAEDDVLVIDTLGDLGALTGCADLVFVGGSLVPHGGHNPLEAAAWGLPLIAGPHVFNFSMIYRDLERVGAARTVSPETLLDTVLECLGASPISNNWTEMGERARAYQSAQADVLERQWVLLSAHLP